MRRLLTRVSARARAVLELARLEPHDTSTAEGRSRERYRRIALSAVVSVVGRAVAAGAALAAAPIALGYLGKERYGLLAVIGSLTTWASLLDLGMTGGLLNAVAEAHGRDDREATRSYFSTAFYSLVAIAALAGAAVAVLLPVVSFPGIIKAPPSVDDRTVVTGFATALSLVIATLPFGAVTQVYVGRQKGYVAIVFTTSAAIMTLLALVASVAAKASFAVVVAVTNSSALLAGVMGLGYLLTREMPGLRPTPSAMSAPALRRVLGTAVPLFLFQIGGLLVNQSQQFVLVRRVGLGTVAEYDVLWKVYVVLASVITLSTASFAPSFRESFERGELAWMRRSFFQLVGIRMALSLGAAALLALAGNLALRLWLGRLDFQYGTTAWLLLGLLLCSTVWTASFVELLTILDRIWPQIVVVLAQGFATIAFTWVLGPKMGVIGALFGVTAPAIGLSAWLFPRMARTVLAGAR